MEDFQVAAGTLVLGAERIFKMMVSAYYAESSLVKYWGLNLIPLMHDESSYSWCKASGRNMMRPKNAP